MPRGRAMPPLVLTGEERETLERWTHRPTTAQALAQRARIVLRCAMGASNQAVARELGATRLTVGRWRQPSPRAADSAAVRAIPPAPIDRIATSSRTSVGKIITTSSGADPLRW